MADPSTYRHAGRRRARRRAERVRAALPGADVDVRRKRPPALLVPAADGDAAARRARRHAAALDFGAALRRHLHGADGQGGRQRRHVGVGTRRSTRRRTRRLRLPRDRAAVRALGAVRRPRAAPGPAEDRLLAVPGDGRRARSTRSPTASSTRATTSSTGRSSSRSSSSARSAGSTRRSPAGCCAPPATGAAPCSSARASTSRTSPTRSRDEVARAGRDARLHLAHAAARTTACARSGGSSDLPQVLDEHGVQEVIIADPDFPEDRAVELVDQCHRRGVTCASRRRRWRSSSTAPSSSRARRCRCSSCARRSSRASTTWSSARSTSSARSLLLLVL